VLKCDVYRQCERLPWLQVSEAVKSH